MDIDDIKARFLGRAHNHAARYQTWYDILPRSHVGTFKCSEWGEAAHEAFVAAGGDGIIGAARDWQNDIDPEAPGKAEWTVAELMATALMRREGIGKVHIAATQAYIKAAAETASLPQYRVWRKERRRTNTALMKLVRTFLAAIEYMPWNEPLSVAHCQSYKAPGMYGGLRHTPARFAQAEFFMAIGIDHEVALRDVGTKQSVEDDLETVKARLEELKAQ